MTPLPNANISVIICTHNPRPDFFRRTLDALKAQTLPQEQWEFLLIDNASEKALADVWDLSWHPRARHVRENELGLTPARLRGIRESKGDLVVFVDDDNLLAGDYLSKAAELFARRPDLGVASGCILPEYESPPPEWFRDYEGWLAVKRIDKSLWSNFFDSRSEPCGAGMCVLRKVALGYMQNATDNARQKILDRRGGSLLSCGDVAITKVALGLGYSMGQFIDLNILHLIPSRRVSEKYLFSLYRSLQASGHLISWAENEKLEDKPLHLSNWRVLLKAALRLVKGGNLERRLVLEESRARGLARKIAREGAANLTAAEPKSSSKL